MRKEERTFPPNVGRELLLLVQLLFLQAAAFWQDEVLEHVPSPSPTPRHPLLSGVLSLCHEPWGGGEEKD